MNQLEFNIRASFTEVRKDIIEIKDQILKIAESQEDLAKLITEKPTTKKKPVKKAKPKVKTITKTIIKTVKPKTVKKTYVGSTEGKKFHIPECPFARNVKPKSKVEFKSIKTALNKGYKPCDCVRKPLN
jgi:hypothetical protein